MSLMIIYNVLRHMNICRKVVRLKEGNPDKSATAESSSFFTVPCFSQSLTTVTSPLFGLPPACAHLLPLPHQFRGYLSIGHILCPQSNKSYQVHLYDSSN